MARRSVAPAVAMLVLGVSPSGGQDRAGDALIPLEQEAGKAHTVWQGLARDLDARLARLLPCDPRAKAGIEEVSRASEERLAALSRYYQTAEALAATRVEGAKQVLAGEEARSAEAAAEETQAALAEFSADQQVADLAQSVRQQQALAAAQAKLAEARETVRRRAALGKQYTERRRAVLESLAALVAAYQERHATVREVRTAFEAERARWSEYYAARLARAQTECDLVSPAPRPAPPKAQGKAK